MKSIETLNIGDQVRIISTGQKVTIDKISAYGFSVIKFKSGGTYHLLNHKLKSTSAEMLSLNDNIS